MANSSPEPHLLRVCNTWLTNGRAAAEATILVTGGAGYIGSHTCVQLLHEGYRVVVVDNLDNSSEQAVKRVAGLAGENGRNLQFFKVDLLDKETLEELFNQIHFDAVIHFAGLKAVGESVKFPLKYYQNNVTGTLNLLEVMSDHGCKKIVFSSSATVYGQPKQVPCTENDELQTLNPYGRSKLYIERVLEDVYASDATWSIVLLRYFNPVGAHPSGRIGEDPRGIPNNLMPFIQQVAVGRRTHLSVFGSDYPTRDGTGVRDYIHVMDLAAGHAAALRRIFMCQAGGCDVYNLGTGKGTTVLEMVAGFERACGQKLPVKLCPRRPGDCSEVFASTDKAQQDLDWRATRTVEDMCRDQWNWARQNPMGYAADEDSEEGEESGAGRDAVNGIGSLGVFKSRGMGCRKLLRLRLSSSAWRLMSATMVGTVRYVLLLALVSLIVVPFVRADDDGFDNTVQSDKIVDDASDNILGSTEVNHVLSKLPASHPLLGALRNPAEHFARFIHRFNKSYAADLHQYRARLRIFRANLLRAAQIQLQDPSAEHGVTPFSDLTPEEFAKTHLGLLPVDSERSARSAFLESLKAEGRLERSELPTGDLPEQFDWREKGAVTGVKNQVRSNREISIGTWFRDNHRGEEGMGIGFGARRERWRVSIRRPILLHLALRPCLSRSIQGMCGSCYAFSAVGALEGAHYLQPPLSILTSPAPPPLSALACAASFFSHLLPTQGMCGSCYAFSAVGALEGAHYLATGELISLSEQQIVDCDHNCDPKEKEACDSGCGGGLMNNVFRYIQKAGGLQTEQEYGYTGREGRC
ncbi:unnamed protein product [Closterium sp. NIES-65]|nr:unnamed protein product [Closterium sp. NIES-65]